jgi:hypothetical protein
MVATTHEHIPGGEHCLAAEARPEPETLAALPVLGGCVIEGGAVRLFDIDIKLIAALSAEGFSDPAATIHGHGSRR